MVSNTFLLQKVRIVSQVFLTRSVLRSGNFSEVFIKIVRLMKKRGSNLSLFYYNWKLGYFLNKAGKKFWSI